MKQPEDTQLETMRLYRALTDRRMDWGGKLMLVTGAGSEMRLAAVAVSIAGGTTLAMHSDAASLKTAQRAGHLDFVVNSLDEALRALKNEVRQKRPLSVGLIASVDATLAEIDKRGVQPDLRLDAARPIRTTEVGEGFFPAADPVTLQGIDAALLTTIPVGDLVRRRWIERAPQFLREARAGGRWIWLSDAELAALAAHAIIPATLP